MKKVLEAKRANIWPEIRFFGIFPNLVYLSSFKLHRIITWNSVSLLVELKFTKKHLWCPNWPQIRLFAIFSKFFYLLSLKLRKMIAWNSLKLLVDVKRTK